MAAFALLSALFLSLFPALALAAPLTTPTGISLDALESEIDRFMMEHIGKASPGAAVAVVKNGEIIFSGAYGMADMENSVPVEEDTVFEYGSVNKMFVWVSVMQLAEQGKLDLDADIRAYLPDEFTQNWEITHSITLRNIMNHSGGFGEYLFDAMVAAEGAEVQLADVLLLQRPHQFLEPGNASAYSNYATGLAAYVVECVSGQAFHQYQKENIFNRLGMTQTAGHVRWEDNPGILENKAQGYTRVGKARFRNTGWSYVSVYPAGSVNGTVEDLAKFAIGLMPSEGEALALFQNPGTLPAMLSSSYAEGESGTAHGFFELDSATSPAFGHGGNTVSFSSQFVIVPEEQFGLVVLTNTGKEMDILFGLQALLVGNRTPQQPDAQDMPNAREVEGSYVGLRRPEKTPMEFVSYLTLTSIQAVDSNTIRLRMAGISGEYVQTEPYIFEITENSAPILRAAYNRLAFKMENGAPVQILLGKGLDMSALPANRTLFHLIISVIIFVVALLLFTISPVVLIATAIKQKKKGIIPGKSFMQVPAGLTFCGTALLLNNVILLLSMMANPMIKASQTVPFGILNYLIVTAGAVALVLRGVNWKKLTTPAQKRGFVITGTVLILFALLLMNWNMFVLYI